MVRLDWKLRDCFNIENINVFLRKDKFWQNLVPSPMNINFVIYIETFTCLESIFASSLAFLIRLTIQRSASSGDMFNFSANILILIH